MRIYLFLLLSISSFRGQKVSGNEENYKKLLTHISGGTRPYRYMIVSTDKDFKEINKHSEDGWIVEFLENPLKPGSTITVDVTDNKEWKVSKKKEVLSEAKPEGTSPPPQMPTGASKPEGTSPPPQPSR